MTDGPAKTAPPDQAQRAIALDPRRSVLVQAPAGSGKTDLLTRRFLRLLTEIEEPGQIVAITFTKAAAAEMRNRILSKLEGAAAQAAAGAASDPASMEALADRALAHSRRLDWNLLDHPSLLRISTIDAFCREFALQKPLLSGIGGGLEISEAPEQLYQRAAQRTLEALAGEDAELRQAIESLLLWRDNNWQELEEMLVSMLVQRDKWMQDFVLSGGNDWKELHDRLERPLVRRSSTARYTGEEWEIVRACFVLLRHAAGELKVIFAETGAADFTEVAQIADRALRGEDGFPTDAAIALADGIRHLLVDEFQDTSRRQTQLLSHLLAAWPEREGRTCFVVGDPMQSIYFFRDADAELFPRVRDYGLQIPSDQPLGLETVTLTANFRTVAALVEELNGAFRRIFAENDGSGIQFAKAEPARKEPHGCWAESSGPRSFLHLEFVPQTPRGRSSSPKDEDENPLTNEDAQKNAKEAIKQEQKEAQRKQIAGIVDLIRGHLQRVADARAKGEKLRIAVLARARRSLAVIAEALREDGVPFRAVDLEALRERPEVIDALALGRALLNPQDRMAWLALLRAPWCALSLADLHALASADEKSLLERPLPELLSERAELLSEQGRCSVRRVLDALAAVPRLRFAQPAVSFGTWLEQVWLRLGGDACVDASGRANVELLWRCLDGLPLGEQDLLGPALDAALEGLKALPNPLAESDYGVQLMTIHGAKGLEFEIVIVPDLQAGERPPSKRMLAWLERGLAEPDGSDEISEFLVAPVQPKGAERGKAKELVDRVYREREKQEMRRLLYVAATRAREELHLCARPEYKTGKGGGLELADPRDSLLKTAWPALEDQIRTRFAEWRAGRGVLEMAPAEEAGATVEAIAASGQDSRIAMPSLQETLPSKPTRLRRLSPDYESGYDVSAESAAQAEIRGLGRLYERHEGGLLSRALGAAVHTLLEELARQRESVDWEAARAAMARLGPRIAAQARAAGIDPAQAASMAAQALDIAKRAAEDPAGRWILSRHADAASEQRWAGVAAGGVRTVQVDRVFRAGERPLSAGGDVWWIVDYKTANAEIADPDLTLPGLRRIFAPQIEAHARVLRNLHGTDAQVRGGLYYPRMLRLDWWEIERS